ncbi:Fe-Mn family superoxide dismutase [symbiont of Argiope bruennichi]|uniref:Fe-Mn family superoxide dismutase n=1 Tax=symbiont of Argiope bruennichi TaxID=2810479 RepID=UPI003DA49370
MEENKINKVLVDNLVTIISNNTAINSYLKLNLNIFLNYYQKMLKNCHILNKFDSIEKLLNNANNLEPDNKICVRENYGGFMNHLYFFLSLTKKSLINKDGQLYKDIEEKFQNYNFFIDIIKKKAKRLFGSGWIWLVSHKNELKIMVFFNEDNPWHKEYFPIIAIDLWEHSYVEKFLSKDDYIDFIFENLNFQFIEEVYQYYLKNNKIFEITKYKLI